MHRIREIYTNFSEAVHMPVASKENIARRSIGNLPFGLLNILLAN